MIGCPRNRLAHIRRPFPGCLSGQSEHEIQVHAGKPRCTHAVISSIDLLDGMLPSERIKERRLKTLDAHRHAGNPDGPQHRQSLFGNRTRGELDRPLQRSATAPRPDDRTKLLQVSRRQQTRRATAPEHGRDGTRPSHQRSLRRDAIQVTLDTPSSRLRLVKCTEITRRGTERNVHVKSQRGVRGGSFGLRWDEAAH